MGSMMLEAAYGAAAMLLVLGVAAAISIAWPRKADVDAWWLPGTGAERSGEGRVRDLMDASAMRAWLETEGWTPRLVLKVKAYGPREPGAGLRDPRITKALTAARGAADTVGTALMLASTEKDWVAPEQTETVRHLMWHGRTTDCCGRSTKELYALGVPFMTITDPTRVTCEEAG